MSYFLSGFHSLSPQLLVVLISGAMGGVVLGAIPGLGPAIAVAVLLPVSFTMEPLMGLSLLLGVYSASVYGGAVPAILINTPGTAVNVLTTFDGYPMARRGEARRALGLAYSASFKLRSYGAAKRELVPGLDHCSHKGLNNRAENSHLLFRKRERVMQGHRSPGGLQLFVSIHSATCNCFSVSARRRAALTIRYHRMEALRVWKAVASIA